MSKNDESTVSPVRGGRAAVRGVRVLGAAFALFVASACGGHVLPVGDGDGGTPGSGGSGPGASGGADNFGGKLVTDPDPGDTLGGSSMGGSSSGGANSICPCTRRVGPPSRRCPLGSGKTASASIGPDGGNVSLDSLNKVKILPGTLTRPLTVSLTELRTPAPPADYVDWSPLYHVAADVEAFDGVAEIDLSWSSPAADSYTVPFDLSLYGSATPEGPYEVLPDDYQNAGFNQATLRGPGYYFVGTPKPAELADCP